MSHDFNNKTVLITGASSGIGKATAIAFAKAGANVAVASRRTDRNEATLAEIKKAGAKGLAITADVSKEADVQRAVAETVKAFGRLDIAFNNAGVEGEGAPVSDVTEAQYKHVFEINVKGVLLSMKHEIAAMLKTGGGAIINTSSVLGHVGVAGMSVYVASKFAVEGLTKAAALEYSKQGIRINAVAPALIETDMSNRLIGGKPEVRAYMEGLHPIGRVGQPDEIAQAVLFLAGGGASFVTGHSLLVDGGLSAQ